MKKVISILLAASMVMPWMTAASAEGELTSSAYTIDTAAKTISKVVPYTAASDFLANLSGDLPISLVNVDGTSTPTYATENVFVKYGSDVYKIVPDYGYNPIADKGAALEDGKVIYDLATNTSNTASAGLARIEPTYFNKLGYGSDNAYVDGVSSKAVNITKQTVNGQPVYSIDNNVDRYRFLRSHYSGNTTQTDIERKYSNKETITTFTFKTDKMGEISLLHNVSQRTSSDKKISAGDTVMSNLVDKEYLKYVPTAVWFKADGTVWLGGSHENFTAAQRSPIHATGATWTANTEYTISVHQKYVQAGQNGYVYGVYLNGEKIFPGNAPESVSGTFELDNSGRYKITTKNYSTRFGGGASSLLFGCAADEPNENINMQISDIKVYEATNYAPAIDAGNKLSVASEAIENNILTVYEGMTAQEALAGITSNGCMGIYESDGITQVNGDAEVSNGMILLAATANGVTGAKYDINVVSLTPVSTAYTVNKENKTISGVIPGTTVAAFLNNFTSNAQKVIDINGTELPGTAYATENAYLVGADDNTYAIVNKYAYDPLPSGSAGYSNVETKYGKLGQAESTSGVGTSRVITTRLNGGNAYVIKNSTGNYSYIYSHTSTDNTRFSTALQTATNAAITKPIVTTFKFTADKLGNISLFSNVPYRDANGDLVTGDTGMDTLNYGQDVPYIANAVHFLEDGSVKLGGRYTVEAKYPERSIPAHETKYNGTSCRWEPNKEYTVTVVQRHAWKERACYVDGVYVNGEKIFPNNETVDVGTRFTVQDDGSYKMNTRGNDYRFGGGISSIMIGAAPKTEGEELEVTISDIKVYMPSQYTSDADEEIAVSASGLVEISGNEIKYSKGMTCQELLSRLTASNAIKKIYNSDGTEASGDDTVADGMYVKLISSNAWSTKTYSVVPENIKINFFTDNNEAISSLTQVRNVVGYKVEIPSVSSLDGTALSVFSAVYDKNTRALLGVAVSSGEKNSDEITVYTSSVDISSYGKTAADVIVKGMIFKAGTIEPLLTADPLN